MGGDKREEGGGDREEDGQIDGWIGSDWMNV